MPLAIPLRATVWHAVLGGALLGLGWLCPAGECTWLRLPLAFGATALLILSLERSDTPKRDLFLGLSLAHLIGFYWLLQTIARFGGLPWSIAGLIFLLFIAYSSAPFVLASIAFRALYPLGAVAATLAWIGAEQMPGRIFPWMLGHLTGESPLAQAADLGGVPLLSGCLVLICSLLLRSRYLAAGIIVVLWLAYGITLGRFGKSLSVGEVPIAVIQGAISVEDKHNIALLENNQESYQRLSQQAMTQEPQPQLIVWPESVLVGGFPVELTSMQQLAAVYQLPRGVQFLFGAITFNYQKQIFNSAVAALKTGELLPPYHKQILMPFGEYTPFVELLPWLAQLNPTAGTGFSAGKKPVVMEFPEGSLAVAPLICYEDVVPAIARQASLAGASVLANMSNDGWFGDSHEGMQHNLIASFRAIENRRFLIRSSNSGITSIISPKGETVAKLPKYKEGILLSRITPLRYKTVYMLLGEAPWVWLSYLVYGITVWCVLVRKKPLFF